MRSQQINKKEENIRAWKIQMNHLWNETSSILIEIALQLQIKRISQVNHYLLDKNTMIIMRITFTENVSIYSLLLHLNTEFWKLR